MPQKKGARRTKKARNVLADKVATGDVRTGPVVPIVEERVTFYDKLVQPVQEHVCEGCEFCTPHQSSPGGPPNKRRLMDGDVRRLDRNWGAVFEAVSGNPTTSKRETMAGVAAKYGLSTSYLYKLVGDAKHYNTLVAMKKTGRHLEVNSPKIDKWLMETVKSSGGNVNVRTLAGAMIEEFGCGSEGSVKRSIKRLGIKKVRLGLEPMLTEATKFARLNWALDRIENESEEHGDETMVVHLDEKWMYAARPKLVYKLPRMRAPVFHVLSRRFVTKVMVLAALGRPVAGKFDGNVAFIVLSRKIRATQTTAHRSKGDIFEQSVNLDSKLFKLLVQKVVVRPLKKGASWTKRLIIQMDNAGGHGGGRGDINETTLKDLDEWYSSCPKECIDAWGSDELPPIEFVAQPPHSPDCNILDLGAWWSLECAVERLQAKNIGRTLRFDELCATVRSAWKEWLKDNKVISNLFQHLKLIHRKIVENGGGNNFEIPHRKKPNKKIKTL